MKKAKVIDGIPPMPEEKANLQDDPGSGIESSSLGIGDTEPVSVELAGDLIALPFQAWSVINPVVDPLSPLEKDNLSKPFAFILEKYGMGKIAKHEILFGFYLTAAIYGRAKAIQEVKKTNAVNDSRKSGTGKNDSSEDVTNKPLI